MSIEVAGTVQSIRLLWDFVKANKTLANYNELVSAVSEVNADLIASQAATITSQKNEIALTEQVRELKQKVMALENWDREAERYALTDFAPGVPTRKLKPGMENGESTHPLCANCFARQKKSYLQYGPQPDEKSCNQCNGSWSPEGQEPKRANVW